MKVSIRIFKIITRIMFLVSTAVFGCCTPGEKRSVDWPSSTYQYSVKNDYPDEISFCIVDLKYDGTCVKICEFGEGLTSQFKGYDRLYGKGVATVWDFMATFACPVWFVGKRLYRNNQKGLAIQHLRDVGGNVIRSPYDLASDEDFQNLIKQAGTKAEIADKACIFIGLGGSEIKKKYPACIFVGQATRDTVINKYKTNNLFQDQEVALFKPLCKSYPKQYTPELAQQIIHDFGCKMFVIKPVNASLGRGIIMVTADELDGTLRLIFKDFKQFTKRELGDSSYSYWAKDHSKYFIVEEFVSSKTIYVHDKPYDPTMRVAFVISNNAGYISTTFLASYWKLPDKTLDEDGAFTEKHKSHITYKSLVGSAEVEQQDFDHVKKLLSLVLPKVYLKMLANYFDKK